MNINLNRGALALILVAAASLPSLALAHAGEDHGAPAAAPSAAHLAPRAESASEDVEALAVYDKGVLTVFLSDFRTNAPLADVEVEIESAANTATAVKSADGVYRADVPWMAAGRNPLVISVLGADVSDLLEVNLELPAPEAEGVNDGRFMGMSSIGIAGSLGGLAAVGLAVFSLRRRKN